MWWEVKSLHIQPHVVLMSSEMISDPLMFSEQSQSEREDPENVPQLKLLRKTSGVKHVFGRKDFISFCFVFILWWFVLNSFMLLVDFKNVFGG